MYSSLSTFGDTADVKPCLTYSDERFNASPINDQEYAFTIALVEVEWFKSALHKVREALSLKQPEKLPKFKTPFSIQTTFFPRLLAEPNLQTFLGEIQKRCELNNEWEAHLVMAVYTDVFVVPSISNGLMLHEGSESASEMDKSFALSAPGIIFRRKVTIRQLKRFIDSHKDEIKALMKDSIEKYLPSQTETRSMLLGRYVAHAKTDEISYQDLEVKLHKEFDDQSEEFQLNQLGCKADNLTYIELNSAHKAFVKLVNKISSLPLRK